MGIIADIHKDLEKGALQLMVEYHGRLTVEAVKLCGDDAQAQDLVFRTFERVLAKSDTYKEDINLFAWMKSIMENIHRNDMKRPVVRGTMAVEADELERYAGADWSTDEQLLRNSDSEAIRAAIAGMDPKYNQVLMMRYYDEFTLKQIADILRLPLGTVCRRMQIAQRIIAGKLKAELGNSKPKLAALAAVLFSFVSFAAWQTVESVWSHFGEEPVAAESALGSLESEGSLGSLGTGADTIDPNPDTVAPHSLTSTTQTVPSPLSATGAGTTGADTLSTTENTEKEKNMNLKSITKSAAKLAVGTAMAAGGFSVRATDATPPAGTAFAYVQKDLVAQWDGIENAGPGQHNSELTVWKDLAGAVDVPLSTYVTVEDRSLYSTANTGKTAANKGQTEVPSDSFPGLTDLKGSTAPVTAEYVMQHVKWRYTDNVQNLQYPVGAPFGYVGFRDSPVKVIQYVPQSTTQNTLLQGALPAGMPATGTNTYSGVFYLGHNAIYCNGQKLTLGSGGYTDAKQSVFKFFGNLRADIRIFGVRFYNRELTDDERLHNFKVDQARFQGVPMLACRPIAEQTWNGVAELKPAVDLVDLATGEPIDASDVEITVVHDATSGTATIVGKESTAYAGQSWTEPFVVRRLASDQLDIKGLPQGIAAVEPAYGVLTGLKEGDEVLCSAPEWQQESSGTAWRRFVGYTVKKRGESGEVDWYEKDGEREFTYVHGSTSACLYWRWSENAQYAVDVEAGPGGSARASADFVDAGGTVTLTAEPEAGYEFVGWQGAVEPEDALSPVVTLTAFKNVETKALFRRADGAIPADYARLEFVETTRKQFFDTGYYCGPKTKMNASIALTGTFNGSGKSGNLFGALEGNYTFSVNFGSGDSNVLFAWLNLTYAGGGIVHSASGAGAFNGRRVALCVDAARQSLTYGGMGVTDAEKATHVYEKTTLVLAGRGEQDAATRIFDYFNMRIYSCEIYDWPTKVRDYVPCRRVSDGELGLYDRINAEFCSFGGEASALEAGDPWNGKEWCPDAVLNLPGNDSWACASSQLIPSLTNFSAVAWLKGGAPKEDYGTLFAQGGLGADGFACYLITNRTPAAGESALRLAFQTRKGDAAYSVYADYASEASDGLWHQVAVTHDFGAKVKRLYVDGVLRGEKTGTPFPNPQNTARFFVGARHANGAYEHALKGRMAEVSLWDRPLSPGEIKAMRYGPLTGRETGLIGYWPFTGDRRITPDRVDNGAYPHDFVLLSTTSLVEDKVGWRKGGTMIIVK